VVFVLASVTAHPTLSRCKIRILYSRVSAPTFDITFQISFHNGNSLQN